MKLGLVDLGAPGAFGFEGAKWRRRRYYFFAMSLDGKG